MHIQATWRVLTIGDGDLSFSAALARRWPTLKITASVLDSEQQLRDKYQLNAIDTLQEAGQRVMFEVDITQPDSLRDKLKASFDVTIFQFPLVPNAGPRRPGQSWHQGEDSNLLNRKLLNAFLRYSQHYLLASNGARLSYITSKDVKPYCDWNIECLAEPGSFRHIGQMPFIPGEFPGYRIRNVDRDKQVKSTAAITYAWSDSPQPQLHRYLTAPPEAAPQYCELCHIGPVTDAQDWQNHLNSRQHRRRAGYQQAWQDYLNATDK